MIVVLQVTNVHGMLQQDSAPFSKIYVLYLIEKVLSDVGDAKLVRIHVQFGDYITGESQIFMEYITN